MQVARLTFAARRRSDRPFRISPLTIYEAKFREKLTKNFQARFGPPAGGRSKQGKMRLRRANWRYMSKRRCISAGTAHATISRHILFRLTLLISICELLA